MNKKTIFFDIDGTIYSHNNGINVISKNVREAISETRNKGHLCFIASGRPMAFLQSTVKKIGFDGYVLANGSHLVYNNQTLEATYLDYDLLKEMIEAFDKLGIEYVLSGEEHAYIDSTHTTMIDFFYRVGATKNDLIHEYDQEEIMRKTVKVEIWCHTQKQIKEAIKYMKQFYYEIHPDQHSIEITSLNKTKASGIERLLELLNMNKEDSICFGDGPNDFEMFEAVGHSIAMGNAIDELKKIADEICLSVDEDGVAYKLREMFKEDE